MARSLETRLRLFAAELEFERLRFVRLVCLCVVGAAALGTAVVTATALVVIAVGEAHRSTVLLLATAFLVAVGVSCLVLALRLGNGRTPFQSSTDALKEDCECLASMTRN